MKKEWRTIRDKVMVYTIEEMESGQVSKTYNSELQELLQKFRVIFKEPEGLPPPTPFDHRISLKDESKVVSVPPYRYPYFQENEIEKQVKGFIAAGTIRPSISPFSSLVLLVKKHDGSWRFCVDYRELNNQTIKDKFRICNNSNVVTSQPSYHFF